MCKELDPDSRNHTEGEICESLVIPTEIPNTNATSQSSTSLAQGDLLQENERKFAELLVDQKEIVETVLRRRFLKGNWERTVLHFN